MKHTIVFLLTVFFALSALSAEEKTISFSAEHMSGTSGKKNGTTVLEGKASVTVGSLLITGDKIELSGTDFRYVLATGNVSGVDSEKGFNFSADILTYDRDLELASFRGKAKLIDSKHDVETTAGMIIYNQKTEIAFLQIDVNLKRKEIVCTSAFATYRRAVSLLDLSGSPLVIRSGDEFRADRISVNLDTEYITLDGSVSGSLKDTKTTESPAAAGTPAASGTSPASAGIPDAPAASYSSAAAGTTAAPAAAVPAPSSSDAPKPALPPPNITGSTPGKEKS